MNEYSDQSREDMQKFYEAQIENLERQLDHQETLIQELKARNTYKEEQFKWFFENSPTSYILITYKGVIIEANTQTEKLLQMDVEQLINIPLITLIGQSYSDLFFDFLASARNQEVFAINEMQVKTRGHQFIYVKMHVVGIDEDKESILIAIENIEEKKRQAYKTHYLNYHDSLTLIGNRQFLEKQMKEMIDEHRLKKQEFALLYMDIDDFKQINESMGHVIGDELLKKTTLRLIKSIDKKSDLMRTGGDEFAVLMPQIKNSDEPKKMAIDMIESVAKPYNLEEHICYVTISVGISIYPRDGGDIHELLMNADAAMYESKRKQKGSYSFSDQKIRSKFESEFKDANALRQSIYNHELSYVMQPIVDEKGSSVLFEILMRWNSKTLGHVTPSYFIPLAEKNHLISYIGDWLLQDVMTNRGMKSIVEEKKLTINISAMQLLENNFISKINTLLQHSSFNSSQIIVEITENVFIENLKTARDITEQLQEMGIKIALDDFGSGYSSLTYLNELDIDYLKMDRSFITDCEYNDKKQQLITLILATAKLLDMEVIAEGVETEAEYDYLKNQGCRLFQGYYFAKPLSLKNCKAYIEKHG